MAESFKALFEDLNQEAIHQQMREGIWYPTHPWAMVKDQRLASLFLAHARRQVNDEMVCYLIDLARIPVYDSTLANHRRRYFYDTYFHITEDLYGHGSAPKVLNLPAEQFVRARELLLPSGSRMDQFKQRVVGPTGSAEVVRLLVDVAFGQCDLLNQNGVTSSFWTTPEFRALNAHELAAKRQRVGAVGPGRRQPRPVIRFP